MAAENAIQTWEHQLKTFGNSECIMWSWGVLGIACATLAPWFVAEDYEPWMTIACVSTFLLYVFAWELRWKTYMRARRGWKLTFLFNSAMNIVAWFIVTKHEYMKGDEWIWFWILISVAVFCLEELGKPVFDFGLLTLCLRMALQIAFAQYIWSYSGFYIGIVCLTLFCSAWQPYFMKVFHEIGRTEEEINRARVRAMVAEAFLQAPLYL